MLTFQQIILRLQEYWGRQGCALLQPYDMEVGAGTSHTATFLRAIGPEPWRAAYVQPSRRPKDGRYGENPNRMQHDYQYQVVLNGMEVTQFTYFQQVGGLECKPITGEITYGTERLAMYLQNVQNVFDLNWTDTLTYGDVYRQNEVEQSAYNFEHADAPMLFRHFSDHEADAKRLIREKLALPAYEKVLKAAHTFNLLDARGAISVTERAAYIGRIRNLARAVSQSYYDSRLRQDFPMCAPGALERLGMNIDALKAAMSAREQA